MNTLLERSQHCWLRNAQGELEPLCLPGIPDESTFNPVPEIKAAAGFGSSLIRRNVFDDSISWNEGLDNAGFPFFLVNRNYDQRNFDVIDGEPVIDGTLRRLTPFNAFATVEGLDHYSIVDELIPAGAAFNNNQDSPTPREFQLETAVAALEYWFQKARFGNLDDTICSDLDKDASENGYSVLRCEEELV
jgi:hypothetical protein